MLAGTAKILPCFDSNDTSAGGSKLSRQLHTHARFVLKQEPGSVIAGTTLHVRHSLPRRNVKPFSDIGAPGRRLAINLNVLCVSLREVRWIDPVTLALERIHRQMNAPPALTFVET